jgi:hypothetical protein
LIKIRQGDSVPLEVGSKEWYSGGKQVLMAGWCNLYFPKREGVHKSSKPRSLKTYLGLFVCLFVCLSFTSHLHSIGHLATFQLYWWRKTSGALPCVISGTNEHLSRTNDLLGIYTLIVLLFIFVFLLLWWIQRFCLCLMLLWMNFEFGTDIKAWLEGLGSMSHSLSQICILLRSFCKDCESEEEFMVM